MQIFCYFMFGDLRLVLCRWVTFMVKFSQYFLHRVKFYKNDWHLIINWYVQQKTLVPKN